MNTFFFLFTFMKGNQYEFETKKKEAMAILPDPCL